MCPKDEMKMTNIRTTHFISLEQWFSIKAVKKWRSSKKHFEGEVRANSKHFLSQRDSHITGSSDCSLFNFFVTVYQNYGLSSFYNTLNFLTFSTKRCFKRLVILPRQHWKWAQRNVVNRFRAKLQVNLIAEARLFAFLRVKNALILIAKTGGTLRHPTAHFTLCSLSAAD